MRLLSFLLLFLATGCYLNEDALNVKALYESKCPEARKVPFETLNSTSKCRGINIIVAAYIEGDALGIKNKTHYLEYLFRDSKGYHDWEALERFRDPQGRAISHLMAEYGNYDEVDDIFMDHRISNLRNLTDPLGENIFHKIVRNEKLYAFSFGEHCNSFSGYLEEPKPNSDRMSKFVHIKNVYGQSALELAASQGKFTKVFFLYECSPVRQEMGKLIAQYGTDLVFQSRITLYPELYDYLLPFLFEKRETENGRFNQKVDNWSLFELNLNTEAFANFVIRQPGAFDRFMADKEIQERIVVNTDVTERAFTDQYGQNVLFYLAMSDLDERPFLKAFLNRNNPGQQNFRGETVFHLLSRQGKRRFLRDLIKSSPREYLKLRDEKGDRPLDVCIDRDTCDLLRKFTPVE